VIIVLYLDVVLLSVGLSIGTGFSIQQYPAMHTVCPPVRCETCVRDVIMPLLLLLFMLVSDDPVGVVVLMMGVVLVGMVLYCFTCCCKV